MKDNFEQCLALVLKNEGGYVNNPKDPGGRTNLGVTQKVWEMYVGHPVTEDDMRALGPIDVAPLYKTEYWNKVHGDELPDGVDYAVFDFAVNSGAGRAIKTLQKCVEVNVDGIIGPNTLSAINEANPRHLATIICEERLSFLQSLPIWGTFGKGWGSRVSAVEAMSFNMAK
jgi:lysozyme family protein